MISSRPRPLTTIPRLRPTFKPERLRRRKAVSIGIATICTDGLVIAADRQITNPAGFKFYECKLLKIPLSEERGTLVLGYAGSPDTMRVVLEALRKKFEHQDKGREQIWEDLQEVLNALLPKRSKDVIQTLCGFCETGTFHILKSFNKEISPVPVWDCVGCADSALIRYLGSIFLENRVHLPLFRAVPICIYLVAQAKKYIEGCGGSTDLIVLTAKGQAIEETGGTLFDTACDVVELYLNGVLTSATEPGVSVEYVQHLIEALRNVIESQTGILTAFLPK